MLAPQLKPTINIDMLRFIRSVFLVFVSKCPGIFAICHWKF